MTRVIKAQEALDAIRSEVARRGGDFVYNENYTQCVYQERTENGYGLSGNPGCIVGGALMLTLGLTFNREDDSISSHIEGTFALARRDIEDVNDVKFTPRASLLLEVAQAVQDNGGSHGVAYGAAHRLYDTLGYSDFVPDEVTA